jgi:hypothetical protein
MALHRIAADLLDRLPTVAAESSRKKSRSKLPLKLSRIGNLPEIKDEDLRRFKRNYGLWL